MENIIIDFLKNNEKFKIFTDILNNEATIKEEEKKDFITVLNKRMDEKFYFIRPMDNRLIFIRSNENSQNKKNMTESNDEKYEQMLQMNKQLDQFDLNSPDWSSKQKNFKEEEEIKKLLDQDSNASFLLENLLDYNSFGKSEASTKISNFKSFVSLKKLKENAKSTTSRIKDLRFASKTYYTEFLPDYRPKIMTTNRCNFLIIFLEILCLTS